MKALKIYYLVGLFGIVGAGQARAVDWTLKGFRYGYCGIYDLANISYYGLSNNAAAGMNQSVFYGDGRTYKEGAVTCFNGSFPARAKGLGCTYYQSSVNIPSYSRLIKVCTFRVTQGANGSSCYVHTSLSQFETESTATRTHVVADPYVYRPAECFLSYVYGDADGRWREQYGMENQIIENSGAIAANSFVRGGYEFKGWNTRADGKGTAYDDGSVIRATSADKGPVTLYAQWAGMDVTVSESGYATETETPAGDIYVWGKPENYDYGFYRYTGAKIEAGRAYYVKRN